MKAVILDWSGTTADAHVIAPAISFCKVFEKHGVPITMEEARLPMGLRLVIFRTSLNRKKLFIYNF